jgi:hypothetical protein
MMDAEAFGAHDRFEIVDRRERVPALGRRLFVDDYIVKVAYFFEFLMRDREAPGNLIARLGAPGGEAQTQMREFISGTPF